MRAQALVARNLRRLRVGRSLSQEALAADAGISLEQIHGTGPNGRIVERDVRAAGKSKVLAIMLTGMGEDGIEGTRAVVARNGHVVAQDEASSVVWGMPGAVAQEGLAAAILPIETMAVHVTGLLRTRTAGFAA